MHKTNLEKIGGWFHLLVPLARRRLRMKETPCCLRARTVALLSLSCFRPPSCGCVVWGRRVCGCGVAWWGLGGVFLLQPLPFFLFLNLHPHTPPSLPCHPHTHPRPHILTTHTHPFPPTAPPHTFPHLPHLPTANPLCMARGAPCPPWLREGAGRWGCGYSPLLPSPPTYRSHTRTYTPHPPSQSALRAGRSTRSAPCPPRRIRALG